MPKIDYHYSYRSPFNYLEPYTKKDEKIFFGRDREIDEVFHLFEKTNLVVIYGPSGSGKSSVAQCGLVNRFYDWKALVVRRNLNIIDSFFEAIEIKESKEGKSKKGLFSSGDCIELREIFDRICNSPEDIRKDYESNALVLELRAFIEKLYLNLPSVPFFIFDQFEELFIENPDTYEIRNFSLLLSLITKRVTYSNVVLCIQTEFFSNLVKLEDYNPNILDYKCEVNDPDEKNIKEIVRGTFKWFNINQVKGDSKEPLSEKEQEECIDEIIKRLRTVGSHLPFVQIYLDKLYVLDFVKTYGEKQELLRTPKKIDLKQFPLNFRIDEIEEYGHIDEILENYINKVNSAVIDANNKIGKSGYEHAVVKFLKYFISDKDTRRAVEVETKPRKSKPERSYFVIKDQIRNEIVKSIWGKDPGDTDETIGDIIDELINARILKFRNGLLEFSHNFLVRVVKGITIDDDITEFYARQFNSAYDTYIARDESKKELLTKQQLKNFTGSINDIFLKVLAEDEFKNFTSLLKRYNESNYIGKIRLGLSSLNFSFSRSSNKKKAQSSKLEYYQRSLRNYRRQMLLKVITIYVLIAVVSAGIIFFKDYNERKEFEINEELLKRDLEQSKINTKKLEQLKSIDSALEFNRTNITKSFNKLSEVKSAIQNDETLKKEEFEFALKTYDKMIQNYNFEPFYLKKIELFTDKGKRKSIKSTKSRKLSDNKYILFAQTPTTLYSTTFDITNSQHKNPWDSIPGEYGSISSFEPYGEREKIRVLFSNKNGLYDVGYSFKDSPIEISNDDIARNLTKLDHVVGEKFIALEDGLVTIDNNAISSVETDNVKIINSKAIGENEEIITVGEYTIKEDPEDPNEKGDSYVIIFRNEWGEPLIALDTINTKNSFEIKFVLDGFKLSDNNNQILFKKDRQVYSLAFTEFDRDSKTQPRISTKVNTFHDQKINSIDNFEDYILVGSDDKTASIYYDQRFMAKEGDEKLIKILRGHTDAVLNVSFLEDSDGKYVLTSSEDATFNVWDVQPTELHSIHRYNESNDMSLKFVNEHLYLGSDRGNEGYLLKFDENLKNPTRLIENTESTNIFNLNGSYGAFDFDSKTNKFLSGLKYNRRVVEFDENGRNVKEIIGWNNSNSYRNATIQSRILDLSVIDKQIVLGTSDGVYYLSIYPDENNKFKNIPDTRLKGSEGISINTVDLHQDGNLAIATSDNTNIYMCDLQDKSCTTLPDAHTDKVTDAVFSPDGNYMISGSYDNTVIIWKTDGTGKFNKIHTISTHNSDIEDLAVAEEDDSIIIASASSDKTVHLHYLNTEDDSLERLNSIIRHDYGLRAITFGQSSNILYTADAMGYIKKWDRSKFMDIIKVRTAVD